MNGNHFNIHDLKREYEKGRKQGAIEQKEKDKIIFVHVEKVKNKERVRIVFADETIQFFDL
jgi:replicative DNA helicase